MTNGKPTEVVLDAADAAFILRADGTHEMYIPDGPDDGAVPDHVVDAMMLGFVLTDHETRALVMVRWQKYVDEKKLVH